MINMHIDEPNLRDVVVTVFDNGKEIVKVCGTDGISATVITAGMKLINEHNFKIEDVMKLQLDVISFKSFCAGSRSESENGSDYC